MFGAHISGHAIGKRRVAAVYPVHIQRQMRKHLHQRMAHMAAAKQGDRLVPGLRDKRPEVIAVSVAAQLMSLTDGPAL